LLAEKEASTAVAKAASMETLEEMPVASVGMEEGWVVEAMEVVMEVAA
jgi:hypothetical protein